MAQYIYGKNAVLERLKAGNLITDLYLLKGNQTLERLVGEYQVAYQLVDKGFLNNLVSGVHQGIVAKIPEFKTYSLTEGLETIKKDKLPLLVMIDGLSDPHNLGAILRNADATAVDGVIISKHRSVSVNATVAKVAAGALENVKIIEVVNLTQTIKKLKNAGYWIVGSALENSTDYRLVDYRMPLVLVIGSEGKGISQLVRENCDYLVQIPMHGIVNSLNAAVASGILLYEISNQRFPVKER